MMHKYINETNDRICLTNGQLSDFYVYLSIIEEVLEHKLVVYPYYSRINDIRKLEWLALSAERGNYRLN